MIYLKSLIFDILTKIEVNILLASIAVLTIRFKLKRLFL